MNMVDAYFQCRSRIKGKWKGYLWWLHTFEVESKQVDGVYMILIKKHDKFLYLDQ